MFTILGMKNKGQWNTEKDAQDFLCYIFGLKDGTNHLSMIGEFADLKLADCKIVPLEENEDKIEVRQVEVLDEVYVEDVGLFEKGRTKTAWELYENDVLVTTFYKEPSEADIEKALNRE